MCFWLLSIKFLAAPPNFWSLPNVTGNQTAKHSLDHETVLGSSWKLGGAAKHLIGKKEKHICWLNFEFCMLLKGNFKIYAN